MTESKSSDNRKLNALVNQSANKMITSFRINKGVKLLEEGVLSMSEIAHLVGFSTPQYFSKIFKEHHGVSPSDFNLSKS